MTLIDRVHRTIRRHELADAETRVVAALSGGSDSVALAQLLQSLDEAGALQFVGICHFNHRLRPAAADEALFCQKLASTLQRPFLVEEECVGDRARRERRSLEDAARTARHAFFERARLSFRADAVALGHTRDDQAETFLLRLVRGAGPRGLAAMHPRRRAIIRPLIECRRSDLRAYLQASGIPFVEDESNHDPRILRNRVRIELLPLLERRFNPSIVDVLADEAHLARGDWQWMEAEADRRMPLVCRDRGSVWRLDAAGLTAMPVGLARVVVRRVLTRTAGGRSVSFGHVEEVLRLAREGGGAVDLPGQRVERFGSEVVLTSRGAAEGRPKPIDQNFFSFPLSIPGEVGPPEAGWVISAEPSDAATPTAAILGRDTTTAVIQHRNGMGPLTVRNRRPGDRFRPVGQSGRKKLQDFFVDRKVPRHQRDLIPVVADQEGRIVWVAGHAMADEFRVTDPEQAVLILRLKLVGGSR